ncbi:MAG: type I restriction endonuclease subunit R [Elusimicrobia bacterium]|nr:type I restriction endonuclease subunit R [Elusimicrobiota bacterium]
MNPYSEEHLVEEPAIKLFAALGWQTVSAMEEVYGAGGTLGRENSGEVMLLPRLRAALKALNPTLPPEAIEAAVTILTRDRSTLSPVAANQEVYELLKGGITVSVPDPKGGQKTERVRVIDWETAKANDLLLVSQFTVTGALYTCRPDLVAFVNGLPVVVIELKKPGVPARQAFDGNLTSYKHEQNGIPQLFWFNAVLIASNGTESRIGSLTADWERFFDWKRIEKENEPRKVSLEVLIRGTCEPSRLLDLMENFTLFSKAKLGTIKVVGQNHQFLGVNNALAAMQTARAAGHGRGGVFWQTQGSGKSYSMVFFAQKVLRKLPGNWTFVIVTDRVELDDQIAKTFKAVGAVSEQESDACHAQSGAQLRELLRGNHRYVFTLIQKFQTAEMLCDRRDVICLVDESHRSQYDTLALNMRAALPNAMFMAFTGTPLIAGEEKTRQVFGDYVSIYDFQQSVDDGATKPLYYENRTPELRLENPDLNEDIYNVIEAADLDEGQERRLERELGRQYHIITRDSRLETVAKDIVTHFLGRGFQGKAMVVSIDKATALKMHDKVRKYWTEERAKVEAELAKLAKYGAKADPDQVQELRRRLDILKTTEKALIVSPAQNEIEQMRALGLDIAPHRRRMRDEKLDEKFKDPNDPLRLVFVCAMWMTGFDVPSCSTIYLDKPMRNHTLMQAIARANRVYPGKPSGLIVDYANVFASLEKALAIYGKGAEGQNPVRDKKALIEELRQTLATTVAFCAKHGVDIAAIEALPTGNLDRLTKIADGVDRLIAPDALRKEFLAQERLVSMLFKAIKPDTAVLEFVSRVACVATIAAAIRERTGESVGADVSMVMGEINRLLDNAIAADGFTIAEGDGKRSGAINLSAIDFEALAKKFQKSKRKNVELEQLKAAIRAQLEKLIRFNRTRADYSAKFEALIESYNSGSRNIDDMFKELLAFTRSLTEEETRHVRENLSEEEQTVFDILTRPAPDLSPAERDEVKKVTKHLLAKLKAVLVINWRQKVRSRAQVMGAIQEILDELPKPYAKDIYERKVSAVFEHVYESYQGEGRSIFQA